MTMTTSELRAQAVALSRKLKIQADLLDQYTCESDYISALGQMHLLRTIRIQLEGILERCANLPATAGK